MWNIIPQYIEPMMTRLKHVEIEHDDAVSVISRYKYNSVLIYADPPYPLSTRAGKMYQHEMSDADHLTLLDALDSHTGSVVLSGYHCALYDERLSMWHVRERIVQAEKGQSRTEVLWLNQTCVDRLGYGPLWGDA